MDLSSINWLLLPASLKAAAIQLFRGMLLFLLLAVDVLTNYRIRVKQGAVT
ncbi:hypothetical protein [Vannielia sp. SX4]|uniref:hypothetical protein n=1 Tax=Vannielia sp. SX4 TaxID=3463852 RepID=UPI004059D47C